MNTGTEQYIVVKLNAVVCITPNYDVAMTLLYENTSPGSVTRLSDLSQVATNARRYSAAARMLYVLT